MGVALGDGAEPRPEAGDGPAVLADAPARRRPQRVLEEGVDGDRHHQPRLDLDRAAHHQLGADDLGRLQLGWLRRPRRPLPGLAADGRPGAPGLGAPDEHQVGAAGLDVRRGAAQELLRRLAAEVGVGGVARGGPDEAGDEKRRIRVAPGEQVDDPDRVEPGEQPGGPGVGLGAARRLGEQLDRLGGESLALADLARADDDRKAGIGGHRRGR